MEETKYWIKHGSNERMPIKSMVNEHLLSAITMVERGSDSRGNPIGDMDIYNKILPNLVLEAATRNILPGGGWDA